MKHMTNTRLIAHELPFLNLRRVSRLRLTRTFNCSKKFSLCLKCGKDRPFSIWTFTWAIFENRFSRFSLERSSILSRLKITGTDWSTFKLNRKDGSRPVLFFRLGPGWWESSASNNKRKHKTKQNISLSPTKKNSTWNKKKRVGHRFFEQTNVVRTPVRTQYSCSVKCTFFTVLYVSLNGLNQEREASVSNEETLDLDKWGSLLLTLF